MPLMTWATHVLQWGSTTRSEPAKASESLKAVLSSDCRSATRLHEAGIASNRGSARRGEYVPGPCNTPPVTPWESAMPKAGWA